MTRTTDPPVPRLMSAKQIAEATGQPRAYAERVMRWCPRIVRNGRTVRVYEADVAQAIERMTQHDEGRQG